MVKKAIFLTGSNDERLVELFSSNELVIHEVIPAPTYARHYVIKDRTFTMQNMGEIVRYGRSIFESIKTELPYISPAQKLTLLLSVPFASEKPKDFKVHLDVMLEALQSCQFFENKDQLENIFILPNLTQKTVIVSVFQLAGTK